MEISLIEQLDKSRYSLLKGLTIGWAIWSGAYILKDLINSKLIIGLILVVGLFGWILFTVNLIKYLRLGKKAKSDNRLKNALNNELHQLYKYKSIFWGFRIILVTISIFFGISLFYNISALMVCEITLYFGILSSFIAALIYYRG